MSTVRRVAKNTIALLFSRIASYALSFVLLIILARALGDVEFGKYSFALSFCSLFAILVDLGLDELVIRDVARDKKRAGQYLGNLIILKLLLGIAVGAAAGVTVNLMGYPSDTKRLVYILSGATIFLGSLRIIYEALFQAYERMEVLAIAKVLNHGFVLGVGVLVLRRGYGATGFILVLLSVALLHTAVLGILVSRWLTKADWNISWHFWKYLIRQGLPFSLTLMFITIYTYIDAVMLSYMKGDAVVGWYSAAYRLLIALNFIPAVLMQAFFPVMSRQYVSSHESLRKNFQTAQRYLIMVVMPIAVGTSVLADKFILLLYGKEFSNSIIALRILIWGLVANFMNWPMGSLLNATDKQHLAAVTTGSCAALNIGLNALLIPRFSYIGSGIATIISYFAVTISYVFITFKYLGRYPLHRFIVKPIISAGIMGITIYYLRFLNLVFLIPLGACIYGLMLYVFGAFHSEDKRLFNLMRL